MSLRITGLVAVAAHADFSWTRFHVHPSVAVGCIALAIAYTLVLGPLRDRFTGADPVPAWRVAFFLGGLIVTFLALNGPIHDLSDGYLFSAHMLQHMLLMLIMPPLLLLGTPVWLARATIGSGRASRAVKALTHPLVAYAAYNAVFIGWHIPRFYNWALTQHGVHIVQHLMFMSAAILMWWPVVGPTPELRRIPEGPLQMVYLFAVAVPGAIVSAIITLSDRVLYPWYEGAPRVLGLTPLEDQRLGGLIMWIPGMLVFWTAITVVFFAWNRDEIRSWRRSPGRPAADQEPSRV